MVVKLKDSLERYIKDHAADLGRMVLYLLRLMSMHPLKRRMRIKPRPGKNITGEGVPSIAAVTELTKFQNDIKTAEGEVTNYNYIAVGAKEQHFNSLIALISSETPTVSAGQTYKAEIVLGAYNTTC